MTGQTLDRIRRMTLREVVWRSAAGTRIGIDRLRSHAVPPRWDRRSLSGAVASLPELATTRAALAAKRWHDAHRALSEHFASAPQRFVIGPRVRSEVAERVRLTFPDGPRQAQVRGDRLLSGEYDLLGYVALRFGSGGAAPDWHYDPVNVRRAPMRFWSSVQYLSPSCGDHKIIWELNRHQHWIALGRAYWLTADPRFREAFTGQLASWLGANPPLVGINWASMLELGLRSVSWMWALNFFVDPTIDDGEPWMVDLLLALDRQLGQIERNLSQYFSPNTHLIGEGLALNVAGPTLPELGASPRREALGRRVLTAEIERQIAPDGGHVERSTHYHRYTLDFYLLALIVARMTHDPIAPVFEQAVSRLACAARLLADDRGRLPRIGDDDAGSLLPICGREADDIRDSLGSAAALVGRSALQVGRMPEECLWLLTHPMFAGALDGLRSAREQATVTSAALPETGCYVSRSTAGDHLVIDAGPHGYRNGGHAHADALSLTLGVRGVPLLIDAGTGCYTTDPALRDRLRSTALHNTLLLDHRPQSIPSGPFHWSHTATATMRRWRTNGRFDYFDGVHDGYSPLEHRRHVFVLHGDLLVVGDLVDGSGMHLACVHWHIHPQWQVDVRGRRAQCSSGDSRVELVVPNGIVERFTGDIATGLGWHSPCYGRIEPATTIRVSDSGVAPMWIVSVLGLDPDNPIVEVDNVRVWAEAGVLGRSAAVRIRRAASTDYFMIAHPIAGVDATWRMAEFETDARAMFCRMDEHRRVTRVAIVDGSRVRTTGKRRVKAVLPREVPDLHLDLGAAVSGAQSGAAAVRVSGPGFAARVLVGGRELPLAVERRAAPRPHARQGCWTS
jgi:hypothetical protein